jgi:N6-adenosine-specific RNA methylase IME4
MVAETMLKLARSQILSWLDSHPKGSTCLEIKRGLGVARESVDLALSELESVGSIIARSGLIVPAPHVVVADPPWPLKDKCPGNGRGAAKHYSTMSLEEIKAFALPPVHPDAWLFLWRVASMPEEALAVVRAWGFTPKAEIVWIKRDPGGKCTPGMGHYVRNTHETCIIATRGKAIPLRLSRRIPSFFEAARPLKPGTKKPLHSAKPDKFFALVERLVRGPRVELFARQQRDGWDCYGDEIGREVGG